MFKILVDTSRPKNQIHCDTLVIIFSICFSVYVNFTFWFQFHWGLYWGTQLMNSINQSNTSNDPDPRCHVASLDHNQLNHSSFNRRKNKQLQVSTFISRFTNLHEESMMTSSNGNIFRITGPLCGEFTGPVEFPTQRPVTRSFDVYFDLRRINGWVNNC